MEIFPCPENFQFPTSNFQSPIDYYSGMAVNSELLKILVCPLCKAPVNLTESGQGLKCSQCRRVYPIRDDIPVMLISEAKVED
jgi:uncharacterized protein YbaR (Trm112 family)